MDYLYFSIPAIILLLFLILIILFHFKKKSVIKKVNSLTLAEKNTILDELAETGGYHYDHCQDIFATRLDAPQKLFGYTNFFDLSAPYFNMVFDYETIYFDYQGKTWLIEMWKGQYGINSGCELGIYHADKVVDPKDYDSPHFKAVDPKDMLDISLKLNHHITKSTSQYGRLGQMRQMHWWLTIFKMGVFSKPEELFVNTSIRFKDQSMMYSFLESFENTLPHIPYKINGLTVYFTFSQSLRTYSTFKRMVRRMALFSCRVYCNLFNYITRPFSKGGDKILYLYYYLPFILRHIFKKITGKKI